MIDSRWASAIALVLVGCGGSSGAVDPRSPSTDEAGSTAKLAVSDAAAAPIDADPIAKVGAADASREAGLYDGSSLCDCYGRPLSCSEPCADPDAALRADAPSDSQTVDPTAACEASFAREFASDASPSTCPQTIPPAQILPDSPAQTVDLCAAATNAYQTICHHVRQPESASTAEACATSCDATLWGWVSERAACVFNCWMPVVCGEPASCGPEPDGKPTIANPSPPPNDLVCFAESCYGSLAPSAI